MAVIPGREPKLAGPESITTGRGLWIPGSPLKRRPGMTINRPDNNTRSIRVTIPQTNFNPPFNITRASHLVFTARDLAASRDFYTEVMGLVASDEDADTLWLRGAEERAHHSLTLKTPTGQPQCERIGMRVFMD